MTVFSTNKNFLDFDWKFNFWKKKLDSTTSFKISKYLKISEKKKLMILARLDGTSL